MEANHEVVIYIHGVCPAVRGHSHDPQYQYFHESVGKHCASWPTNYCGIEWGWNHSPGPPEGHQLLSDAQRLLGAPTFEAIDEIRDLTLKPTSRVVANRLRPKIFYGCGDIFFYVSRHGKQSVRRTVATQILDHLRPYLETDSRISLTFVGHSAGSVVAFDLLFFLFFREHIEKEYSFLDDEDTPRTLTTELAHLRELVVANRLRVRRLVSMGSPITPLAVRSADAVAILAQGQRLNPVDYGLHASPPGFEALTGPRWMNYWDRDDPIGWPVEPLMEPSPAVKDVYVDVSDSVRAAHQAYWRSKKLHRHLAEHW